MGFFKFRVSSLLESPEGEKVPYFAKRKRLLYLGCGIMESEPVGLDTPVGATFTNLIV